MTLISKAEWTEFYRLREEAHFLQSSEWGELKQQYNWEVIRIINGGGGAQILIRKGPLGTRIGYIPKGPVGKISNELIDEIILTARTRNCFALTIEPDFWEGEIEIGRFIKDAKPGRNIQPHRTLVISLAGNEDNWIDRMKQKTRYNIRLAEKKGVAVQATEDIPLFYSLMEKTGQRDGFGIHSKLYYQKVYEYFAPKGDCAVLLAEFEGQILGALMVIAHGKRSWYVYGASNDIERNRMPTYLLQWEAMKWAARKGCEIYDLWGIPDEDLETLEQQFETRSDGLWGVYRFKRGFGGEIKRSIDAVDIVINPLLYSLYRRISSRNNYQVG
jgi:peptidoglycan pentaglycine glycine transferase (the first glycine)